MGACTLPPSISLVSEFIEGGSVYDVIYKSKDPLSTKTAFQIALQICNAMQYLHSCQPAIIHRDLKCANVLIDKHFSVKIADFGLHSIKPKTEQLDQLIGVPVWLAPEILRGDPFN